MNARPVSSGSSQLVTIGGNLTVRRPGFGAMRIHGGDAWGEPRDRASALNLLRRVVEAGVNFIDTADSYGPDLSEQLIADALYPYPRDLVIATKGGYLRPKQDRWDPDCSPSHIRAACEGSLRRLKRQHIDLYQLHGVDPRVPIEELISALRELQREGKIGHIGVSNVSENDLVRAQRVATIASVQNRYNLEDRSSDRIIELCANNGLVFLSYFPLASGRLVQAGGKVAQIALKYNATAAQIAIAWLLRRSPALLPIPGTSSIAHFEENLRSADLALSEADYSELTNS